MAREGGPAQGRHGDGVDSLRDETFIAGSVEALDEDGLSFWHEDQVMEGLDFKSKFLIWNDVEWAEF